MERSVSALQVSFLPLVQIVNANVQFREVESFPYLHSLIGTVVNFKVVAVSIVLSNVVNFVPLFFLPCLFCNVISSRLCLLESVIQRLCLGLILACPCPMVFFDILKFNMDSF